MTIVHTVEFAFFANYLPNNAPNISYICSLIQWKLFNERNQIPRRKKSVDVLPEAQCSLKQTKIYLGFVTSVLLHPHTYKVMMKKTCVQKTCHENNWVKKSTDILEGIMKIVWTFLWLYGITTGSKWNENQERENQRPVTRCTYSARKSFFLLLLFRIRKMSIKKLSIEM